MNNGSIKTDYAVSTCLISMMIVLFEMIVAPSSRVYPFYFVGFHDWIFALFVPIGMIRFYFHSKILEKISQSTLPSLARNDNLPTTQTQNSSDTHLTETLHHNPTYNPVLVIWETVFNEVMFRWVLPVVLAIAVAIFVSVFFRDFPLDLDAFLSTILGNLSRHSTFTDLVTLSIIFWAFVQSVSLLRQSDWSLLNILDIVVAISTYTLVTLSAGLVFAVLGRTAVNLIGFMYYRSTLRRSEAIHNRMTTSIKA